MKFPENLQPYRELTLYSFSKWVYRIKILQLFAALYICQ